MMKTCTGPCKMTKATRYFSTRKGRFKKDGTPMFLSICKKCGALAEKNRSKKRKRSDKGTELCAKCNCKISMYATYCRRCNVSKDRKEHKNKTGTINPKWLVRGTVHSTGSGFTQFTQP